MNIYCFYDRVGEKVFATFSSPNDGLAIRENIRGIAKVMPIGDVDLYQVGEINDSTCVLTPVSPRLVSWDSYKFPENPLKPLDPNEKDLTIAKQSVQSA